MIPRAACCPASPTCHTDAPQLIRHQPLQSKHHNTSKMSPQGHAGPGDHERQLTALRLHALAQRQSTRRASPPAAGPTASATQTPFHGPSWNPSRFWKNRTARNATRMPQKPTSWPRRPSAPPCRTRSSSPSTARAGWPPSRRRKRPPLPHRTPFKPHCPRCAPPPIRSPHPLAHRHALENDIMRSDWGGKKYR